MTNLAGKKAVVTGGTRGIGRAIVERLLVQGADVVATGRSINATVPSRATFRAVDCTQPDSIEAFAAYLSDLSPDILINNAGMNRAMPFVEIDPAIFLAVQQVNVTAPLRFCQAVIPGMRRGRWGRIVSISSIYGTISRSGRATYSASKFALDGMMAALAAEVAADGILANCVAPGFTETDMTRTVMGEKLMVELAGQIPIGRLAQPDEIAALVAWLVGTENTYISGQNIVIDGGFTRV